MQLTIAQVRRLGAFSLIAALLSLFLSVPALAASPGWVDQAVTLKSGSLSKLDSLSSKSNSVRVYKYVAPETGIYAFYTQSVGSHSALDTRGELYNATGTKRLYANSQPSDSGKDKNFYIRAHLTKGDTYLLRVTYEGKSASYSGRYRLRISAPAKGAGNVSRVTVSPSRKSLSLGKSTSLKASVRPSSAYRTVTWKSANPKVATVSSKGTVTAVSPGTTVITATSFNGKVGRCTVTVKPRYVTSVKVTPAKATKLVGETQQLKATVSPSTASIKALTWSSSNPSVARVDENGKVTCVGKGTCTITATATDGSKKKGSMKLTVEGNHRALLIGEGRAAVVRFNDDISFTLDARACARNEVAGFESMLGRNSFGGNRYATTSLVNTSKAAVMASIRNTFQGAQAGDTSLVYISCHGGPLPDGSDYALFPCNDGYITSAELEAELRKVPGDIVLIVESCYSGNLISKGSQSRVDQSISRFLATFQQNGVMSKTGEFADSKYKVLVAAAPYEESWYRSFNDRTGNWSDATSSGFFTRAVLKGAGWDVVNRRAYSRWYADANRNGAVTLKELYAYAKKQVANAKIIDGDGVRHTQTVQCYPASSAFVVFDH